MFTISLAAASGWLLESAVRTLGKQWAVAARLVEGHKLITAGPYAYVRNPIYTGMLGMLIATGLAMEHWIATIVAVIIFFIRPGDPRADRREVVAGGVWGGVRRLRHDECLRSFREFIEDSKVFTR